MARIFTRSFFKPKRLQNNTFTFSAILATMRTATRMHKLGWYPRSCFSRTKTLGIGFLKKKKMLNVWVREWGLIELSKLFLLRKEMMDLLL